MATVNVKRSIQFRADLYRKADRTAWFDAVGKELETKGIILKVGEGANVKEVKNADELKAAYGELRQAATTAGNSLKGYVNELLQAIDDVVKGDAKLQTGDKFDLSMGSPIAKALGLDDEVRNNYAAMTTEFGRAAASKPEATLAIDGVTLQIREPIDLSQIPHMSAETLRGAPVGYGRDGEEVEDTRVITGLTKDETVKLATDALNDLQRPRAAAGLTLGQVPLDEMSWDSDAHALRRANPYVSFTLDTRSLETNPNNGQPRVAVGRDFFFDTFMAKKDLEEGKLVKDLQKAELMYRSRIRYGNDRDPFQGTRVLIGMKEGTAIDASGTKHARKIDSRTDSPNQAVFDTLNASAITGKLDASWSFGGGSVAPAAAAMYRTAVLKGITDDTGGETSVLVLEPAAVARQIRGRFHLNETNPAGLQQGFNTAGEPSITALAQLIGAAQDWPASGNLPSKADLLAQANALIDRSAIVSAATSGLKKIDPNLTVDRALIDSLWPSQTVTSKLDAKKQRVVADAIRTQYDLFAENVDELQRQIGGTTERSVRDAGRATDVRDFLRQKAAVARLMAYGESNSASGVVIGNPATYTAYAKTIIDMPDGRPKADLLQNIGVGLNQLRDMTDASFASPVKVNRELVKKQTFAPYLAELDAQVAGPNMQAFATELGAFLAENNSPALANATDKAQVLADVRKNLVTAHVEVLHRQVEAAASWGQALWFNNYRQTALGINAQAWNFIIGSMDYSEFYDAKTGGALSFQERVSRRPLDAARMTGAMISNDMQIELQSEEGYTAAIKKAQYALNGAAAGLLMDFALSKSTPGLTAGDAAAFEQWIQTQAALPNAERAAFLNEVDAFAKDKGSPINITQLFPAVVEQVEAVRSLVGFAQEKNPTMNGSDRAAVQNWYRTQSALAETELNGFLTDLAQYGARVKQEIPLSPNLLRTLDFGAFTASHVGQPTTTHASLVDDLQVAQEVWSMVKKAQQDLSVARGQEVQRVLRDNNLRDKGWEPPTKAKGDYAIDSVIT